MDTLPLQPLAWSTAHAIGITEIDDQHIHLAVLIDRLSAALKATFDSDAILAGLNALMQYAAYHFATEERLMERHQVADLARHREEYRRLLHDIVNLQVDGELPSVSLVLHC